MRASILPSLFCVFATCAWAGGGEKYASSSSSDSDDEFVVIGDAHSPLSVFSREASPAENISEEEAIEPNSGDTITLFTQKGKLFYEGGTPVENLWESEGVTYHQCFLESAFPVLNLACTENREVLCKKVLESLKEGIVWRRIPAPGTQHATDLLQKVHEDQILPALIVPERTDDSGRNWRHTKGHKDGFSCTLSKEKPANVLIGPVESGRLLIF